LITRSIKEITMNELIEIGSIVEDTKGSSIGIHKDVAGTCTTKNTGQSC